MVAVSTTMLATVIAFFVVATRVSRWKPVLVIPFTGVVGLLDPTCLLAGLPKLFDGARVSLGIAGVVAMIAETWRAECRAVARGMAAGHERLETFLAEHSSLKQAAQLTITVLTDDPRPEFLLSNDDLWLALLIAEDQYGFMDDRSDVDSLRGHLDNGARVVIKRRTSRLVRAARDVRIYGAPCAGTGPAKVCSGAIRYRQRDNRVRLCNPVIVPNAHGYRLGNVGFSRGFSATSKGWCSNWKFRQAAASS